MERGGVDLGIPGLEDAAPIGRGGFAVVYRAFQPAFRRTVAVKVLTNVDLDEQARNRFERECHAMGLLSEHPGIVTVYDAGFTPDERPYLVMAYVAGGTLADRIREDGPGDWRRACRVGIRLAGALETAHRAEIIHRDIKPANVLISTYGAQLTDFGIARIAGGPETRSGVVTASLAHAAPEILDGKRPTVAADVYSLGSTLYAYLAGGPAFVRDTDESILPMMLRIASDPVPDLRAHGVPDQVCRVVERAMSKNPEERQRSARELGSELQEVERELGLPFTELIVDPGGVRSPLAVEHDSISAAPDPAPADADRGPEDEGPDVAATALVDTGEQQTAADPSLDDGQPPLPGSTTAPAPPPALLPATPETGPRRGALIAGAAAAVVLLVVAAVALFSGGGDDPVAGATTTTANTAGTSSTAATTTTRATNTTAGVTTTAAPTTTTVAVAGTANTAPTTTMPAFECADMCARINSIAIDGNALVVDWTEFGFVPDVRDFHAHFFWNDIEPAQAGSNAASFGVARGDWELTDRQPFRSGGEMRVSQRPSAADRVCVTVADGSHGVVDPAVYQCVPLPAVAAGWTVRVVDTGDVGSDIGIAAGVDGNLVVSYRDFGTFGQSAVKVARCNDFACAEARISSPLQGSHTFGISSAIAIPGSGNPVLAFGDGTDGEVLVLGCVDAACTDLESLTTVDQLGASFVDLTIGNDGLPFIVYTSGGSLVGAHCTSATCDSATRVVIDGSVDFTGAYPAVVAGPAGPLVAYRRGLQELVVAACTDDLCTSASRVVIDAEVEVAPYTALVLGADGFPVITYVDSDFSVRLARCFDVTCGAAPEINTIDGPGDSTGVAVGPDGYPVVVYRRLPVDAAELVVAYCGDAACRSTTSAVVGGGEGYGEFARIVYLPDALPAVAFHEPGSGSLLVARPLG